MTNSPAIFAGGISALLAFIACSSGNAARPGTGGATGDSGPASGGVSASGGGSSGGTGTGGTVMGGTGGGSMIASGGATADGAAGAVDDPDPVITADARTALKALRYDASPPPKDPSNRVADDAAAQAFGQKLFYDPSLSGRLLESDNDGSASTLGKMGEAGKVSCAGCHLSASGFVDTRSPHHQISLAANWSRRRTPTLLDVAFFPLYNWDARRDSLWSQAIGVMENSAEFNSSRLFIAEQIFKNDRAAYEAIFGPMPALDDAKTYPALDPLTAGCDAGPADIAKCRGKPGDKADYDGMTADAQKAVTTVIVNTAKALTAFVRELRCGSSRFDQWIDGDDTALSRSEQRGAALFVGSGKCDTCHSGSHFSDGKFHNVGLRPATVAVAFNDTNDRGAGESLPLLLDDPLNSKGAFSDGDRKVLPATVGSEYEGAFQTPTLRCIANQPSFMHTAQDATLDIVIRFFNRGGDTAGFPGTSEIAALGLSDREQTDLVNFIGALEGKGPDAALLAPPKN